MFGRRGAPTKRSPHTPENVGPQRDNFWPAGASFWRIVTFKSLLGAARHSLAYARLTNSESRISNHFFRIIAAKLRTVITLKLRLVFIH